ncbi:hypothetical protein [Chryseobacterium indologenes]|uniref:hypothetical protein n=1 Tax=Chryseobacterium indologenes TaxID=253 RepID=UPI00405A3048
MMIKIFSLTFTKVRRFLLFILLICNLQIIKAVSRCNKETSSDNPIQTGIIFIVEGTTITGIENVNISYPDKKRSDSKLRKKGAIVQGKKKRRKKFHISVAHKYSVALFLFRKAPTSETSLLISSDRQKQFINPDQNKKEQIKPENSFHVSICLSDICFKNTYKSHWFSTFNFFRNYQRPPPDNHVIFLTSV